MPLDTGSMYIQSTLLMRSFKGLVCGKLLHGVHERAGLASDETPIRVLISKLPSPPQSCADLRTRRCLCARCLVPSHCSDGCRSVVEAGYSGRKVLCLLVEVNFCSVCKSPCSRLIKRHPNPAVKQSRVPGPRSQPGNIVKLIYVACHGIKGAHSIPLVQLVFPPLFFVSQDEKFSSLWNQSCNIVFR